MTVINLQQRYALFRFCGEKEIAVHDENEMPMTYATEREAQIEALDELTEIIAQFKNGSRNYDEIMFQPDEWVEAVNVDENGIVYDAHGKPYGKRT